MPRHRTHNSRMVYLFPHDFPQRLERFQRESALTWAEIARRVGTSDLNLRRWRQGVRPHWRHLAALLELAEDLGLAHLFTGWTLGEEPGDENPSPGAPSVRRSLGRQPAARGSG